VEACRCRDVDGKWRRTDRVRKARGLLLLECVHVLRWEGANGEQRKKMEIMADVTTVD